MQSVDFAGQTSAWVPSSSSIKIDTVAPSVLNITSAPSLISSVNGMFYVDVLFSEPVAVTSGPNIKLLLDNTVGVDGAADYYLNSTDLVTFKMTTPSNFYTPDLDVVSASALSLNGGLIKDLAGNAAILTLPLGSNASSLKSTSSVEIDTAPPTPPSDVKISISSMLPSITTMEVEYTKGIDPNLVGHLVKACTDSFCTSSCTAEVTDLLSSNAGSVTLGGLQPNTKYYACVQAKDLYDHRSAFVSSTKTKSLSTKFVKNISLSIQHACAVLGDSTLHCWGTNDLGQLNSPNFMVVEEPFLAPVDVGTSLGSKFVAVGSGFNCALLTNNQIKCWGNNSYGQLGVGNQTSTTVPNVPVILGTGRTAKSLAVGSYYACAILDNDQVKCWGQNTIGQLGIGNQTAQSTPVEVDLGSGLTAKSISISDSTTCAILSDDSLKCWGSGSTFGASSYVLTPSDSLNIGNGRKAVQKNGPCVLLDNGQMGCYATNANNNVPTTGTTFKTVTNPAGLSIIAFGSSGMMACATYSNYEAQCWGSNDQSRLGLGFSSGSSAPLPLPLAQGEYPIAYNIGNDNCILTNHYEIKCWGTNSYGNLGNGESARIKSLLHQNVPTLSGKIVADIQSTRSGFCVIYTDGTVNCDGYYLAGENLPSAGLTDTRSILNFGSGRSVIKLFSSTGGSFVDRCALLDTLEFSCWTHAGSPSIGMISALYGVQDAAIGSSHKCAILSDGNLICWGQNTSGQLGYGDTTFRGTPQNTVAVVNVGAGRTVKKVTAGESHTCAILDNDSVRCWGANSSGQLGYGDMTARTLPSATPVNLGTGRTAVAIEANDYSTCAILDNGSAACWGFGGGYMKGDGSFTSGIQSPYILNVGSGKTVKRLALAPNYQCVILNDDSAKCWGATVESNVLGGAGLPQQNIAQSTIPIPSGESFKKISVTDYAGCALSNSLKIYCWGIGLPASLQGYGSRWTPGAAIDFWKSPRVIRVTGSWTSTKNATTGTTVPIHVDFSHPVTISNSSDIKLLIKTASGTTREASYSSQSPGQTRLTFTYTVQAGDSTNTVEYESINALIKGATGDILTASGSVVDITLPPTKSPKSLAGQSPFGFNVIP